MPETTATATTTAVPLPRCTYRVQLRSGVGFGEVERLVPYLARLGASHLYLAPPFTARSGSTHGYDVADPAGLDPALGGREGYERLARAARAAGLGIVLDIVPNHMGVGPDNPWWVDVLKNGRESRFAGFFDIDFDRDPDGRLVLPTLGAPLDEVLDKGELELKPGEGGELALHYYDAPFPLAPGSAGGMVPGKPDAAAMRALLDRQHYRLAFWRDGEARNYRRFFDIGELAGLRVELPDVFEAAHALILDLAAKGLVQGLRVDHVDGLSDPGGYLERLQLRLREATGSAAPFPVWVEKILSGDERLPAAWPVAGTTGYEFANQVLGLLVDPAGLDELERLRAEVTGEDAPFPEVVDTAKRLVLRDLFPGELAVLAGRAAALTGLPGDDCRAALVELLVAFPVYRTYRRAGDPLSDADRAVLDRVVAAARPRLWGDAGRALDALRALVEGDPGADAARLGWVTGLQQLSGPVMAKALEDTAFYRYPRLLALNEVGGEPDAHGIEPEAFHALNAERLRDWPGAMLGTATHDTKRGEDARARLAVLSEIPAEWAEAARSWRGLAAGARPEGLHPKDEYTLFQALVGAWPVGLRADDATALGVLAERVRGYLAKALREGKERSSWLDRDASYEEAVLGFVAALLDPARSAPFLGALEAFVRRVAPAGEANALAQLLVKLAAPGVPDVYQGTELWDLSLVDPDNRRPVDWDRLARLLDETESGSADGAAPKPAVLARVLAVRREAPDLFAAGEYLPLALEGPLARHALAFARRRAGTVAVAVAGRRLAGLVGGDRPYVDPDRWGDTALALPERLAGATLDDRLAAGGGRRVTLRGDRLRLGDVLAGGLPVALLVGTTSAPPA